ncbi:Response regulator receiver domain-containing protein [Mucilaginibacter gossypiicola]|uniref:Response regulator receiver domain-containing protein n=1 Tax=Mucilaginibacter gossypiicola TaxID=551995 RepID=A0A1H8RYU3_9SPHI|nr:response regulator [Mucilaginibacter gossypiicola]SEO71540.1 Response regulator receiver domain-containing protein [Mucilaginibacter gossypiicola]
MIAERDPVNTWIVDDDSIYVYGLKKLIGIKGINTRLSHFINGQEALNALNNANDDHVLPDIILLDINMPIMDGWEFMNEFAKLKPQMGKNITVYIMSPSLDLNDIHRAKNISEITDYIFKPVKPNHLTEIFDQTIRQANENIMKYGT